MRYKLFDIGPLSIHSYGLMIAIGFLAALFIAVKRAKKLGLDPDFTSSLALECLVGGLIGAKLLFFIVEIDTIISDPGVILNYLANGFVVYGGIIGGILSAYVYCRVKKVNFLKYFDLLIPSVAIAQGFGRIGCFLAGCCYGRESDCAISIVFTNSPYAPNNVPLLPTQIFSSLGNFGIAAILIFFVSKKASKDGIVACAYLILYGVGRFIIEIFRNDPRGNFGALSTSQFISIFIVLFGIGLAVFISKKKDTAPIE